MRRTIRITSAVGLLRVLLAASVVGPLLLFVFVSWLNYRATVADAIRDLERTTEVAREHASKVFDGQAQVADRVTDLVRDLDDAQIVAGERRLHDALASIVAHLPQIQSVMLASVGGHPLVSAGTYPVPHDVDLTARDYFQEAMGGPDSSHISNVQVGDVNRQLFFGVSSASRATDGHIAGVIDIAVSPAFFRDFYQALASEGGSNEAGEVVTLVRDDGQILVRFPPFDGLPPHLQGPNPFFAAIEAAPDSGVYENRSIVDPGNPVRVFAYRKVQGYPLYVVAGRSRTAILAVWQRAVAGQLIFGVPATLALFAITWTALGRTRREEEALAVAQQEMQRRELAEDALLRAQRLDAIGQMTGGVAHDFNNLLTVIVGNVEMMDRRAEDPVRVRRLCANVLLAARRGAEVTQQLLAFSRRTLVKPETIDLNFRLREFRALLERAAQETVAIIFHLDPALWLVRLDPGQFESAVLNLVGNARDAMTTGGRITITTGNVVLRVADAGDLPPGSYVRVLVADSGSGMNAATAAKAFEPFFTTKEVGHGTGLGLSQVYGFAKQAGGDVRIATTPGRGTTVELLLPRTELPLAVTVGGSEPTRRGTHQGEVVLVVEDEPAVLEMAVETLTDLGYTTLTAGTAQAALEQLRRNDRVDVLFSDVVMPGGVNGVQLSLEARRLRPALKVLLTSGYTAAAMDITAATEFRLLTKPYDRLQLAQNLAAVLDS